MSKAKCSSENPMTCRYHGHDAQVTYVKDQQQKAEAAKDFEGYFNATKTLEALEKRKQVIEGLDKSLKEAVFTGDFSRYAALTDSFKEVAGVDYEKEVSGKPAPEKPTASTIDRYDEEGFRYASALSDEVANGAYHPDRIHSINEYGEAVAYVRADSYTYHNYPDDMRIQASRPLTDAEVQRVAQLTGYQHRSTLNGEGLSDPDRCGNASVLVGTDNTKSSGRKSMFSDFEDGLEATLQEGSPVRKTDRSGPGTKGTRLIEGFGSDVNFTLYYQDTSVKFDKVPVKLEKKPAKK
jgi:hypothetical protein